MNNDEQLWNCFLLTNTENFKPSEINFYYGWLYCGFGIDFDYFWNKEENYLAKFEEIMSECLKLVSLKWEMIKIRKVSKLSY
jgi:hypothetical protein